MQKKSYDTTWKWIKHRLDLQELNFSKLASIHDIDRTCFTGVKKVPIPKYEYLIADYINTDPWLLWPDRYDAAHNLNHVSSRYQGHKSFVEHASKEINGKVAEGK
ncbi:MAG: helix-turn-helix domain-containing protein [Smithellaceae bacterium]|jgi:lambda repressor-like predicted transcriptional regulator